jgi:Xaa-Pro aminopeptidase
MHLQDSLRQRRQKLAQRFKHPVALWSGCSSPRNFRSNTFPFRASSHFLYFAGLPLEDAVIRMEAGSLELFIDEGTPSSALWHGETPTRQELAEAIGADAAFPLAELDKRVQNVTTIAVQSESTCQQQSKFLKRDISATPSGHDLELAAAIVALRLTHDQGAVEELRLAAQVTVSAHLAGMAATPTAKRESEIRAAMESMIMAEDMSCSYQSIVTVHGEVLHNNHYHHPIHAGDLLLADVGAETATGWAADVTRTWPVSGRFSATQRAIYEVVLAAHDACLAKLAPDVEYQDLHLLAAQVITEGLVDLGILQGEPEDLVAMDAHALFFPHGVGHLLGLDVHDMEDLGDLAGYEQGRSRSNRFGLCYLRLNRPLRPGMLVTIEPGFYQVPALLQDPERRAKYQKVVDWERLEAFADVRGIRIEDDVLVTESGHEVLTGALPTAPNAIEDLTSGSS